MPASQGDKDQSFMTAKEKWLIGIFIATAVIASVTFVVNLVLLLQLKDSIHTSETDDLLKHFQNRTANLENKMIQKQNEVQDFQKIMTKFENELRQSKTETEDLRQEYQSNMTQLQLQNQKEVEDLREEFQSKITQLLQNQKELEDSRQVFQSKMTELDNAVVKTNILYLEKLDKDGWKELSNGLRYHRFDEAIAYSTASEKCKMQGARLASTGIRDGTISSEMGDTFSSGWTWIGLNQPYDSTTWVWSDGKSFEEADITWVWTTCMTRTDRHGKIKYQYYSRDQRSYLTISCYDGVHYDVTGYICEI